VVSERYLVSLSGAACFFLCVVYRRFCCFFVCCSCGLLLSTSTSEGLCLLWFFGFGLLVAGVFVFVLRTVKNKLVISSSILRFYVTTIMLFFCRLLWCLTA
jgi:hypothetical protein